MDKLFIVSPSYAGDFCSQYVESLAATVKDCMDNDVRTLYKTISGVHWIDITRDIAAHIFLHTNCNYMLQIDTDLGWEADAPRKMMKHRGDVVGGVYPLKTNLIQKVVPVKNRVPGGFMMVSRDVIETMTEKRKDESYFCSSLQYGKLKVAPLFRRQFVDDGYVGEDYAFCDRAIADGFKVETFKGLKFSHVGIKEWKGE